MFEALDLDIRPGFGLGIFELGASLWTVLDLLRSNANSFPQVEVKFERDSPTTPVILHLRPHIDLLFSGNHQRLHTICVRKLRDPHPPMRLRYKSTILSSPEENLRRVGVSRAFGPTYPGDDLRYPGVWFTFEEENGNGAHHVRGGSPRPEDRDLEVKRVVVSQKNAESEPADVLSEVQYTPAMDGDIEKAIVKVHEGVVLHFYPTSEEPVRIQLGITTAQDLILELGAPLRVHYREDSRMNIHAKSRHEDEGIDTGYFYNYFQLGIDFLLSGTTHVVKKIILHTNIPGTPLFQRYKRCPWAIEGKPEDDEDDTPPRKWYHERHEEITHFLNPKETPPTMQLNRTDDEDGLTLPDSTTRLLGFDGIILEVTESAHVTTVMLF